MNPGRMLAVVLVVLGGLALAYGGFSYTRDTHTADVGALHVSVDEKEHVQVPVWAGGAMLLAGVLMLVVPVKK